MPYLHVVSYAFSRSKKIATTRSPLIKPSLTMSQVLQDDQLYFVKQKLILNSKDTIQVFH